MKDAFGRSRDKTIRETKENGGRQLTNVVFVKSPKPKTEEVLNDDMHNASKYIVKYVEVGRRDECMHVKIL